MGYVERYALCGGESVVEWVMALCRLAWQQSRAAALPEDWKIFKVKDDM